MKTQDTDTTVTELVPRDGRASFYGKARVVEQDGRKYLVSYGEVMASVDKDGKVARHSAYRSHTTDRHVKSFLETFGRDVRDGRRFRELPVEGGLEAATTIRKAAER